MNIRLVTAFVSLLFLSCNQKETSNIEVIKFDNKIIDTLTKTSDTTYSTFIGRYDFYTEDVYANKKDSLVTKILKDSLGNVVGINKSKKGIVILAAEYYTNGQLKGKTQFKPGIIDGPATYYYPNGRVRSIGQWHNYRQVGIWKNYEETGELKETIYYDSSGNILKTDSLH
jgi:antitoxin component YwqK of YwqJK toxin-antitoxin module